jgi:hypothetical protein
MKKSIKFIIVLVTIILSSCSKNEDNSTATTNTPDNSVVIFADQVQAAIQKNISFSLTGNLPTDIANINWDFGEGPVFYGNSSNNSVYHQYQNTGTYIVKAKIIRQNGTIIESTKSITIVNSNIVKITKITIQSYYQKNCLRFVTTNGVNGSWVPFNGEWDESNGFGPSTSIDRYSDTYMIISKYQDIPNSTNPSNLVQNVKTTFTTTGISMNKQNDVFNFNTQNIVLSLNAINNFEVKLMDYEATNSINENGTADEIVGNLSIPTSSFQNNSFTYNVSGLQIQIDYVNIN